MAPHSSTLAWKIPWTEEPGRLQIHGVPKSRTQLSDLTFTFQFHALKKEMATHFSVLAWRIPGPGEAWWAAIYGVAQSWTRLKWLSSSIISSKQPWCNNVQWLAWISSLLVESYHVTSDQASQNSGKSPFQYRFVAVVEKSLHHNALWIWGFENSQDTMLANAKCSYRYKLP